MRDGRAGQVRPARAGRTLSSTVRVQRPASTARVRSGRRFDGSRVDGSAPDGRAVAGRSVEHPLAEGRRHAGAQRARRVRQGRVHPAPRHQGRRWPLHRARRPPPFRSTTRRTTCSGLPSRRSRCPVRRRVVPEPRGGAPARRGQAGRCAMREDRAMTARSPRAVPPGPGQESVWDYPRPPRAEPDSRRAILRYGGVVVADTTDLVRVLETSHPPTFYPPPHRLRRVPDACGPHDVLRVEGCRPLRRHRRAGRGAAAQRGLVVPRAGPPVRQDVGIVDRASYVSSARARFGCRAVRRQAWAMLASPRPPDRWPDLLHGEAGRRPGRPIVHRWTFVCRCRHLAQAGFRSPQDASRVCSAVARDPPVRPHSGSVSA